MIYPMVSSIYPLDSFGNMKTFFQDKKPRRIVAVTFNPLYNYSLREMAWIRLNLSLDLCSPYASLKV